MQITDDVVRDLKAKHAGTELIKIRTPSPDGDDEKAIEVVVRCPTDAEWKMVRTMAADPEPVKKVESSRVLVNACVLYPSGQALLDLIRSRPALVDVWGGEISELAGAIKGSTRSKL
jgi:hypothetical protein